VVERAARRQAAAAAAAVQEVVEEVVEEEEEEEEEELLQVRLGVDRAGNPTLLLALLALECRSRQQTLDSQFGRKSCQMQSER
jgi:hypothetical protein